MSATKPRSFFAQGYRDGLPFLVVASPFGLMFGVLATEAGLNMVEVLGMTILVVAGAAQLAAIQLMVEDAPTFIVLATALAVNLRMAMYSASLAPWLGAASLKRRLVMAYFLVDQSYALSLQKFEDRPEMTLDQRIAYYNGTFTAILPFWFGASIIGAVIGTSIPAEWSLDMAMPLTFLALVGPMLRTFAHMAAAMTSCVLALALAFVPYNLGLLVAAIAALAVGAEIERRKDAR